MSPLYEATMESYVIKRFVAEGDTVFDVGANGGDWTELVLQIRPSVRLYLFEPIKLCCEKLLQRFKGLTVVNKAIYDSDGHVDFYIYSKVGFSTIYRRVQAEKNLGMKAPNKPILVPTITIDSYCQDNEISHIDYLKIDTEGAEFDVLKGAERMLSSRQIDHIEFEYGGTYLDSNVTLENVYNYLVKKDYRVSRCFNDHLECIPEFSPKYENYKFSMFIANLEKA